MTRFPVVVRTRAESGAGSFERISKSLTSLLESRLPPQADVLVGRDASSDPRLEPFISALKCSHKRLRVMESATLEVAAREYPDAPFLVTAENDVSYPHDWLEKLIEASEELARIGLKAIVSGESAGAQAPHARIALPRSQASLVWRQRGRMWLLPREVCATVGPFRDEGIDIEARICHTARLHGVAIVCLEPGIVAHPRWLEQVRSGARRLAWRARGGAVGGPARILGPVRWGSEWVHEGEIPGGQSRAICNLQELLGLGWDEAEAVRRARSMLEARAPGPFAITAVGSGSTPGGAVAEHAWSYWPSLRELKRYWPQALRDPLDIACTILSELAPLHSRGLVHNKARLENVYQDRVTGRVALAWLGIEPHSGTRLWSDDDSLIERLSNALSARTARAIRERYATRFLEFVAPEVIDGVAASPASDVFAAAAVALRACGEELETLSTLRARRRQWEAGVFPEVPRGFPIEAETFLAKCLETNPARRFSGAREALASLTKSAAVHRQSVR